MHLAVDRILVGDRTKVSKCCRHGALVDAHDRLLILDAVLDQILDGTDLQIMLLSEDLEIGTPCHAPVLVENLDNDGSRAEARHAGQVATGLGMAGTHQCAARLGHERKDVARLDNILRARIL